MPSPQTRTIPEKVLLFWSSSMPCSAWLRGKLWIHLRFVWLGLMALTVLCVAIEMLGMGRQSRKSMTLKQSSNEKSYSMKLTHEFMKTFTTEQAAQKQRQSDGMPVSKHTQHLNTGGVTEQGETNGQRYWGPLHISEAASRTSTRVITRDKANKVDYLEAGNELSLEKYIMERRWAVPNLGTGILAVGGSAGVTGRRLWESQTPHRNGVTASQRTRGQKTPQTIRKTGLVLSRTQPPALTPDRGPLAAAVRPAKRETAVCQPEKHIVFLKTHKTASSTILNILYRYGESRNLTFALPLHQQSQLFYPMFFSAHFVEGFRSKVITEYDIMCNHMRFMPDEIKKVMPEDTFYFSILRNPVSMMESIFTYYKSIDAFRKTSSLDEFLDDPWRFYNASVPNNQYAKNLLTFDFGFDNNYNGSDEEIHARLMVKVIEKKFDLILISEYFDESMILLKNALCWTLDDVVSFRLNSRSNKTRKELSPQSTDKIRVWNGLDWKIYLHFNVTFWQKVDTMVGREQMKREVARLQQKRELLTKTCLMEGGAVDPSHVKDDALKPFQYGTAVIQGYNLKPGLTGRIRKRCQDLITPELQFTAALYDRQFPQLAAKLASIQKQSASRRVMTISRSRSLEPKVQGRLMSGGQRQRNPSIRQNVFPKVPATRGLRNMP